jgi:hypothetical protein
MYRGGRLRGGGKRGRGYRGLRGLPEPEIPGGRARGTKKADAVGHEQQPCIYSIYSQHYCQRQCQRQWQWA